MLQEDTDSMFSIFIVFYMLIVKCSNVAIMLQVETFGYCFNIQPFCGIVANNEIQ